VEKGAAAAWEQRRGSYFPRLPPDLTPSALRRQVAVEGGRREPCTLHISEKYCRGERRSMSKGRVFRSLGSLVLIGWRRLNAFLSIARLFPRVRFFVFFSLLFSCIHSGEEEDRACVWFGGHTCPHHVFSICKQLVSRPLHAAGRVSCRGVIWRGSASAKREVERSLLTPLTRSSGRPEDGGARTGRKQPKALSSWGRPGRFRVRIAWQVEGVGQKNTFQQQCTSSNRSNERGLRLSLFLLLCGWYRSEKTHWLTIQSKNVARPRGPEAPPVVGVKQARADPRSSGGCKGKSFVLVSWENEGATTVVQRRKESWWTLRFPFGRECLGGRKPLEAAGGRVE